MTGSINRCRVLAQLMSACLVFGVYGTCVLADRFTYVDRQGQQQSVDARLAGTGAGMLALERADGQYEIVPAAAVKSRVPGDDPVPITPAEMAQQLEERFGAERFRYRIGEPCVVGLVLTAPLADDGLTRLDRFFNNAAGFMQSIDRVFSNFAREMKLTLSSPRFPLVLLIFETDADFEEYARTTLGNAKTPGTSRILGFYSHNTNWLAIRLDECDSFEVPLHEAIHQQVYNRGLFQRFAPVPVWFDEGIATGFENDGAKINADPTRVNRAYAGRAKSRFNLTFADIISSDAPFQGEVLAGEAYTLAWCLHWQIVTSHPQEYAEYVRRLGQLPPLALPNSQARLAEFQELFGIDPTQLAATIGAQLDAAARKQRVRIAPPAPNVGSISLQDQMGHVEVGLVQRADNGGYVQGIGKLRNLSPIRPLTFKVTLLTRGSAPIEWVLPDVAPGRKVDLARIRVPPSASRAYSLSILSALPESEEAQSWGMSAAGR